MNTVRQIWERIWGFITQKSDPNDPKPCHTRLLPSTVMMSQRVQPDTFRRDDIPVTTRRNEKGWTSNEGNSCYKLVDNRASGSQSRTRTCNLAINSRLLCQLSYLGMRMTLENLAGTGHY